MAEIVGLLTEVFTWVGFGGGAVVLVLALVVKIADGTWLPAQGAVEPTDAGPVVRWFDEHGNVSEAPLSDAELRMLGGREMIDLWYRRGWLGRMRLHRGSRAARALLSAGLALIAIGVLSTILQLVVLAMGG